MRRLLMMCVAMAVTLVCGGCAPMVFHPYVGDAEQGTVRFSACRPNNHIPDGISVQRQGIEATLRLARHEGRDYLELQLAIAAGQTVTLDSARVLLRRSGADAVIASDFPNVSLAGSPIITSYRNDATAQQWLLPVTAPLVGARVVMPGYAKDKNYWLATYLDLADAQEVWITLPGWRINGVADMLPQMRFVRQAMLGVGLFNC